jgi:hypothetical protein
VTLDALRNSRYGILLLRVFAIASMAIVILPSLLATYLGIKSQWYTGPIELNTTAFAATALIESFIRAPNDIVQTFLMAFPPVAFCLAYAGRKNVVLTPFGAGLLAVLLFGVFLGIGLSIFLTGGGRQLPCADSATCVSWLASRCAESGRHCLTYFMLIIGFDRLSSAKAAANSSQ